MIGGLPISLQDLEDEAMKLRTHKQPITDRAQMLNQTLSVSNCYQFIFIANSNILYVQFELPYNVTFSPSI